MVHLYFTFPQDTLTRSTKLICRTLVMVHMLARRHPSGPSWSKPQSTKNTSFYRKPLSYCNNLQLSIRLLWCPPQNKTSTTPANKIFNDAFMLLRSKPVLPNQNWGWSHFDLACETMLFLSSFWSCTRKSDKAMVSFSLTFSNWGLNKCKGHLHLLRNRMLWRCYDHFDVVIWSPILRLPKIDLVLNICIFCSLLLKLLLTHPSCISSQFNLFPVKLTNQTSCHTQSDHSLPAST